MVDIKTIQLVFLTKTLFNYEGKRNAENIYDKRY